MFGFETFITLMFMVVLAYLPLFLSLKKDLENCQDIEDNLKEQKIRRYKRYFNILNISTIVFIAIILLLYFLPTISKMKVEELEIDFSVLLKIVPFKNGFFLNEKFKFSYITGLILSLLVMIFLIYFSLEELIIKRWIAILSYVLMVFGLIWLNYFFSNILAFHICKYYEFLSIVLNLLGYFVIGFILLSVLTFLENV